MNNKEKIIERLNKSIIFISQKNESDKNEFRKMLWIALNSKTKEINLSVDFLMDFLKK